MLDFVATGPNHNQRWRRRLPTGQTVRLGRAPLEGWAVPWDLRISREHVDLRLVGERLEVRCLETARNPVYRLEQPTKQFEIGPGEEFRIGGTTFRLERVSTNPPTDAVDAPPGAPAASDVEALKAQVAALQSQLAAFADTRQRDMEVQRCLPDDEVDQLRAQVVALKEQVAKQRRPTDEKDRQIAELQAQLESMQAQRADAPQPNASSSTPKPSASSPPSAAAPGANVVEESKREPAGPAKAAAKPDIEALKARLEAQAAAKRKLRHEPFGAPPLSEASDIVPPHNGVQQAGEGTPDRAHERKSTLFVLKAQIEAQAAKLREEGKSSGAKPVGGKPGGDSRQSDVEALKSLLEARAAEQAQVSAERAKSDSSRRSSHITALLALHDARNAERLAAAKRDASDRSSRDDNCDETDEPVQIEALDDNHDVNDDTKCWSGSLIARVWRELPADVQEIVREIASDCVVDEGARARVVAALNRLLVSRSFLNNAELHDALQAVAGRDHAREGRFSEAEMRWAARHALAGVLPGLPARESAAADSRDARLGRGDSFGIDEIITGRVHGATYAAASSPGGRMPIELVRIDSGALLQLRETSPEFRAAWNRQSP